MLRFHIQKQDYPVINIFARGATMRSQDEKKCPTCGRLSFMLNPKLGFRTCGTCGYAEGRLGDS